MAALLEQRFAKPAIALREQQAQHWMRWLARLQDHFARGSSRDRGRPARPAGDLRDDLPHWLPGAEIGAVERLVGRDDADQRQPLEVVALGEQLRADQDVHTAFADVTEQAL